MTNADTISVNEVFTQLAPDHETILVSLPYRIGLYVSYADVTGGFEAQDKEQQSLANILREYSEDFCKTEFCQKVLMETLERRDQWLAWSKQIDSVPDEAGKIVDILTPMFSDKELRAFKEVLADIAVSVAMAFHEGRDGDYAPAPSKSTGGFLGMFKKPADTGPLDHVHVSAAERAALMCVCTAMKHQMQR